MKNAYTKNYNILFPLSKTINVRSIASAHEVNGKMYDAAHMHDCLHELIYSESGTCFAHWNGEDLPLVAGHCVLVPPKVHHCINSFSDDSRAVVIVFECEGIPELPEKHIFSVSPELRTIISMLTDELKRAFRLKAGKLAIHDIRENKDAPFGSQDLVGTLIEQIVVLLIREAMSEPVDPVRHHMDYKARKTLVSQVCVYINSHLNENLTVSDIAAAFHYSRGHLSALFKEMMGVGVSEYIMSRKLAMASDLVGNTELPFKEISESLGFSSPEYFSRRFTAYFVSPPSRFRMLQQAKNRLSAPADTEISSGTV